MSTLEIRTFYSSAVDLDAWVPTSAEDLYLDLCLTVGEPGSEAGNDFHGLIASPEALRKHARGDIISQRVTLVFGRYSPEVLHQTLTRIVVDCQGRDWDESVQLLSRYLRWEYEDYSTRGAACRLELRQCSSPQVGVEWWRPDSYGDVDFDLHLTIEEEGSTVEEGFAVRVATPEGLRQNAASDVLVERATLILGDFSPDLLRRTLDELLTECAGWSWAHSVQKLLRFLRRRPQS